MSFRLHLLITLLALVITTHVVLLSAASYLTSKNTGHPHKQTLIFNSDSSLQNMAILNSSEPANGTGNENSSDVTNTPLATLLTGAHKEILYIFLGSFSALSLLSIWLSKYLAKPILSVYKAAFKIDRGQQIFISKNAYRYKETRTLATTLASLKANIEKQDSVIRHHTRHDKLTNLLNYQSALETLEQDTNKERNQEITAMRLSFNEFSSINSTLGYIRGDEIITELSNRLHQLATVNLHSFRLYNSEFLLIIYGQKVDKDWLDDFFSFLCSPIFLHSSSSIRPSFSSGIARFPMDGRDAHLLLRRTDIALNEAHKNTTQYEFYSESIEKINLRKSIIINDLNTAIANQELWMDYQPKVKTSEGNVNHFEALMRWNHPTLGLIFPDEFIEIAEQTGSIKQLSQWVLTHVCQQLHTWQQSGHLLSVAINLSANDINDQTLPEKISTLMADYELAPWQLSIEITESAALKDIDTAINVLNKISALGISLAIDDFGTGYSSLSQLKLLPVDELKIDKSFILRLNTEMRNLEIVSSTIQLGHTLGLKIIAEGVENFDAANTLAKLGCDFLQGYWIAKPMPAHQVIQWLKKFETIKFKD
ncbi:putative bifunctional diguanylate cyclase/phosphodiesterase [Vreelandella profundi]|uniref:putative bifunctional diguanylate cyclase/phosphodiesterase n=1 Tax=Vreelandella profundi TaxID=2852117 RepID=UPI001EF03F65|nr:GGDEF domain-containing phosphodiesterase [Halomonas profundi]